MELTAWLIATLTGHAAEASPDPEDVVEACGPGEAIQCALDRLEVAPALRFPVLDLEAKAATARYADKVDKAGKVVRRGAVKRTAYPPVNLQGRKIVIVLHQVGAERSSSNPRWHLITAHRTIKPDGTRCRLHPLRTRLVCSNAFDRAPFHGIGIEIGGNFEGVDGDGRWYKPDTFGRGRASDAQLEATRQEVAGVCEEIAALGFEVYGIAPHRVSGRDAKGNPNRPICPGSRPWSEVGEWAGAELGLRVPGPTFKLGGTPVPPEWHGRHWPRCRRFL